MSLNCQKLHYTDREGCYLPWPLIRVHCFIFYSIYVKVLNTLASCRLPKYSPVSRTVWYIPDVFFLYKYSSKTTSPEAKIKNNKIDNKRSHPAGLRMLALLYRMVSSVWFDDCIGFFLSGNVSIWSEIRNLKKCVGNRCSFIHTKSEICWQRIGALLEPRSGLEYVWE